MEKCPICYETKELVKFDVCTHSFCASCKPKLSKCALCRVKVRDDYPGPVVVVATSGKGIRALGTFESIRVMDKNYSMIQPLMTW